MPAPYYAHAPDFEHNVGFLVSEANGYQSREVGLLDQSPDIYMPGTVLGFITATRRFTRLNPAGTDGSQNAVAILANRADARDAPARETIIARMAEINGLMLLVGVHWPAGITVAQRNAAVAQLGDAQRQIIVRT